MSQKLSQWLKPGVSAIALISLLTISIQTMGASTSTAQTPSVQTQQAQQSNTRRPTRLPAQVRNAVLRTHAQQFNSAIAKLRVVSFSRETWSDTCLGLAKPEELCGSALVNGWRVEVSDGSQRQFYRTNATGRVIRIEAEAINNAGSLPQAVGQKVLAIAAKDFRVPVSQLKIAAARSRVWNGCLGVSGPNEFCTMIGIPGWQVIVTAPQQYGVYHLDQTATQIKRNPTTSGQGTIVPTFWQPDVSSVPTDRDILFQSFTSGGIAGQAYKTLLKRDGQVVRIEMRRQPPAVPTLIRKLSPQEVQEFIQTLQQNEFGDFLGFNYPTTVGADYYTIAFTLPGGTQGTQYVDLVQDQTPTKLQQVIQAWNRITSPGSR